MSKKSSTLARSAAGKATSAQTAAAVPTSNDSNGHLVPADAIRHRAYEKWEAAGKPNGDDVRFWLEAEKELTALLSPSLLRTLPTKK